MTQVLWSQDVFSKGEISPLMYARISVSPYYNGLKRAQNVITFPQGAAGKRFGTYYLNDLTEYITTSDQVYFKSMQYLNECIYLIAIVPGKVLIYLEGMLIRTITGSPIGSNLIRSIDHTVLDNIFRVTTGILPPQDIIRSPSAPITITGVVANQFTFGVPIDYPYISPVRFTTTGALPTTSPQIIALKTYFSSSTSTSRLKIYATAIDAANGINEFTLVNSGTGTNNLIALNDWTIGNSPLTNYPVFDFGEVDYSSFTFTPSATTGNAITITSSSPIFTAANVGGTFTGGGGIARILSLTSSTIVVAVVLVAFSGTGAILGSLSTVTEPVWSATRGWPRVCSSFQNRAFFANTDLLPNGLWGSVTNDYNDFNDSQAGADNAISWYPTSDDINFIRFIVPYRSLTIHTNSGVYSTPLSVEQAITPSNFSLTIQDSTPADAVQPRGIDNQIVILSGNDAHSLLWDGFNNAYTANIISIANEQLLRDPVDEAAFTDLTRAGSRYMLIVNADGSLAIYQTLISEDVQGFTPGFLQQSYGNAYFRWVTTSYGGRGWFVTQRELATHTGEGPLIATEVPSDVFTLNAFLLEPDVITAIKFVTVNPSDDYLVTNPQVDSETYYWALSENGTTFHAYLTQQDAAADINRITAELVPINNEVELWPLNTKFFIEELSFLAKTDCTFKYSGVATSSFTNLPNYNAQEVKINGDGYGFNYIGINDTVETIAHGQLREVRVAQIGFPINVTIEPLPLSIYGTSLKGSNLLSPKHIRTASLMFADTIGAQVNGIPVAMDTFNEFLIDAPPVPTNGIFELSIMQGWDDFKDLGIVVTHNEPFDIKLIGIFYKVDV